MKIKLLITLMLAFGLIGFSQTTITWEGTSGGSWQDHLNWNPQQVPTLFDDVVIPSGTSHDPQLFGDAEVNNLTINAGATLTINPNHTLYYLGDITVNGTLTVNGTVEMAVVTSSTGETWMDRNLGASQVATASDDEDAYGDLYQWGRFTEGHEDRDSGTTSTNATTAVPNAGNSWDGLFITESDNPKDWLTPQDNTLWQGASGTNNPCPTGFRLPTKGEWDLEHGTWASQDSDGAFGSPLKLVVGGWRNNHGSLSWVGSNGFYWSSSISGGDAWYLYFYFSDGAGTSSKYRAYSFSVRCIRD